MIIQTRPTFVPLHEIFSRHHTCVLKPNILKEKNSDRGVARRGFHSAGIFKTCAHSKVFSVLFLRNFLRANGINNLLFRSLIDIFILHTYILGYQVEAVWWTRHQVKYLYIKQVPRYKTKNAN